MIFNHSRFQIWNSSQHPYLHSLSDFFYTNPAVPGVSNVQTALDYMLAVLYPQSKPAVATVAALPAGGNTINDMRTVTDDGDGKAASYRWEQREGEATPTWHKIYDIDWGVDSILQGFLLKTQDLYVKQWGYDDLDAAGTPVAGLYAGQSIYGGASANSNLTLLANSGDGTGAHTGFVQVDDNFRPTVNATYSSGTTAIRWLKTWSVEGQFGTLNVQGGSITDSLGTIDFDNENLTTDGDILAGTVTGTVSGVFATMTLATGSITDSTGAISFGNENLTSTGNISGAVMTGSTSGVFGAAGDMTITAGSITSVSGAISFGNENLTTTGNLSGAVVTGSTSGVFASDMTITSGSIISASGAITFGNENLVTTGTLGAGAITGTQVNADNLRLDGNTLSSLDANGLINLAPNGTGHVTVSSNFLPTSDGTLDLGATASRFNNIFFDGSIGDGTTTITQATIQALRDINVGVGNGMSIFWTGTKWEASLPDTEVDHGTISGIADDDHTQYALLAGRGTSQVLKGGLAASNNLELWSTAHATQGSVIWKGILQPEGDNTRDVGTASFQVKDMYIAGQLIGARAQNATTAGRPAASAGTPGRFIYDSDLKDLFVDVGGSWRQLSIQVVKVVDTTGWNGSVEFVSYDVTAYNVDARDMHWQLKDNSNSYVNSGGDITHTSATNVTVTMGTGMPPAAGTYTLIGIG